MTECQNLICEQIMKYLLMVEKNYKYMSRLKSQLCYFTESIGWIEQCYYLLVKEHSGYNCECGLAKGKRR